MLNKIPMVFFSLFPWVIKYRQYLFPHIRTTIFFMQIHVLLTSAVYFGDIMMHLCEPVEIKDIFSEEFCKGGEQTVSGVAMVVIIAK